MQGQHINASPAWTAPQQSRSVEAPQTTEPWSRYNTIAWTIGRIVFIVAGSGAFALLAMAAKAQPYFFFDLPVAQFLQAVQLPALDMMTEALTKLGWPPASNILAGIAIVAFLLARHLFAAIVQAVAGMSGVTLYYSLRDLVDRPRPSDDMVRVAFDLGGSSFPSGHVLIFTSLYLTTAFLIFNRVRSSAIRAAVFAFIGISLALIGYSRIYMGQHWPSDLIGGYLVGMLVAVAMWQIDLWQMSIRRRIVASYRNKLTA